MKIASGKILSIQPNPARRFVTFTVNDPKFEKGILKVYDVSGKLVTEFNQPLISDEPVRLELNPGAYFAKYITQNQTTTKKFVIVE